MKMATPETLKKFSPHLSMKGLKKAYVTEENVKEQYDRYINLLNEFDALFRKGQKFSSFLRSRQNRSRRKPHSNHKPRQSACGGNQP